MINHRQSGHGALLGAHWPGSVDALGRGVRVLSNNESAHLEGREPGVRFFLVEEVCWGGCIKIPNGAEGVGNTRAGLLRKGSRRGSSPYGLVAGWGPTPVILPMWRIQGLLQGGAGGSLIIAPIVTGLL